MPYEHSAKPDLAGGFVLEVDDALEISEPIKMRNFQGAVVVLSLKGFNERATITHLFSPTSHRTMCFIKLIKSQVL